MLIAKRARLCRRFVDDHLSLGEFKMEQGMRTVNEMLDRFEKERVINLSERTRIDYKRHIQNLRPTFGAKAASSVTRVDVQEFLNVASGKIHRNKLVSILSSAYEEAVRWGWVDSNPCTYVERHASEKRDRGLTEGEYQEFRELVLKAKRSGVRAALIMDLLRHTGLSQGAILGLRWSQISEKYGTIKVAGRTRLVVTITPKIRALLDQAKSLSGKSEFVVPSGRGVRYTSEGFRAIYQRLMRKFEKTGNEKFNFHDIKKLYIEAEKTEKSDKVVDMFSRLPHFEVGLRLEASEMSQHYEVFYCLEKSIRRLIVDTMQSVHGSGWWDACSIDQQIRKDVDTLITREADSGMSQRSNRKIDYTTFGQLSPIIVDNWDVFKKVLRSQKAVGSVMATLNRIRGSIAHCCPMSELEVTRLGVGVTDWQNLVLRS